MVAICACSEAHFWTNFLTDEAKWTYTTEQSDIQKFPVIPSTDHNKHHAWLEKLVIHSAGSVATLIRWYDLIINTLNF